MFSPTTLATRLIKKELSGSFPGVKFSVRKDSNAWYDNVIVSYKDGRINENTVRGMVDKYRGFKFNGMTDNYDPQEPVMVDGEAHSFPIGYVTVVNGAY